MIRRHTQSDNAATAETIHLYNDLKQSQISQPEGKQKLKKLTINDKDTRKSSWAKLKQVIFMRLFTKLWFYSDISLRAMSHTGLPHALHIGRLLCSDIFQFHCACLRTEICLRELTLSRTLNLNTKSFRSVDPQLSHKLLFYVH